MGPDNSAARNRRKEIRMKRLVVPVGTFALLAGMVGCSSNPREGVLKATIGAVDKATAQLRNVKANINAAVEKSTKEKKDLTEADFKPAVAAADELKKVAKELQTLREHADALKDSTPKEEREQLAQQYKGSLQGALVQLEKAQTEVNQAIKQVEDRGGNDQKAIDIVKKALAQAQGEFEGLTKQ
jgi:chromosome segregation ATPase